MADQTSPYILQHAENPVHWRPWGRSALDAAKRDDKPIFLSIGYSTCHWCHVMERDVFEDQAIAQLLNEHFTCIKVDREERPDIDEFYMAATHLITGQGGWPNSVWLTPEGNPWMAGAYFPPKDFSQLNQRLIDLWNTDRERVETQATRITQAIRQALQADESEEKEVIGIDRALVNRAVVSLSDKFDAAHGGFGTGEKFPPPMLDCDYCSLSARETIKIACCRKSSRHSIQWPMAGFAIILEVGFIGTLWTVHGRLRISRRCSTTMLS